MRTLLICTMIVFQSFSFSYSDETTDFFSITSYEPFVCFYEIDELNKLIYKIGQNEASKIYYDSDKYKVVISDGVIEFIEVEEVK